MALTTLSNMINPEVLADMVDVKLHDLIRFSPLAEVDTTLVGRPGDTLTFPSFQYIGDAAVLNEGVSLTPASLCTGSVSATIHKIAKGVEITDEAVLSGYGDPMGQAAMQIATAIANKLDLEMLGVLSGVGSTRVYSTASSATSLAPSDVNDALELFGEDIDVGTKVLVCSPRLYTAIRNTNNTWLPASEIAAEAKVRGAVGEIFGCQVIVSNKLKKDSAADEVAYIVKPGALRVVLKRDTLIESDRDILTFTTLITASKHEVCYLYDESKVVKMVKGT